jgi:hypothetical protein
MGGNDAASHYEDQARVIYIAAKSSYVFNKLSDPKIAIEIGRARFRVLFGI